MTKVVFFTIILAAFFNICFGYNAAPTDILKDVKGHWEKYKKTYKLKIHPDHDERHKNIFHLNTKFVQEHNQKNLTYKVKLNGFAHLDTEDFKKHKGLVVSQSFTERAKNFFHHPGAKALIDRDWRKEGIISPVKNQGQCGSCWAFSTTGVLEGYYAKIFKKGILLSEQDLVDCSKKYGNNGCNGGFYDNAFRYVQNHGLNSEKKYPYDAKEGACKHDDKKKHLTITSYFDLPPGNETALSYTLSTEGPVSVAIDASLKSFQFYQSGIYYDPICSSTNLDHAVLAVGIGSKPEPYYIVKNSWGQGWGENGYIMIARNRKNLCGIATAPAFPVIGKPNKSDL